MIFGTSKVLMIFGIFVLLALAGSALFFFEIPFFEKSKILAPVSVGEFDNFSDDLSAGYYTQTYTWNYKGYEQNYTFSVPISSYDYYRQQPHEGARDYTYYALSEYDRPFLKQMIRVFEENGQNNRFTKDDIALNVIAFVQAMPYLSDYETTGYEEYPRYPLETIADGGGDCDDSVILTAALLYEMGYDVVVIHFLDIDHMAVGISGLKNSSGTYYEHNNNRYYYVETTLAGWRVGELPDDFAHSDLELFPMTPLPSLFVQMTHEYLRHDRNVFYYTVNCSVTNNGPAPAENVTVELFAEAPPYDMSQFWAPMYTVDLGTISENETGSAQVILQVPRRKNSCITCAVWGTRFPPIYTHSDMFYVN